MLNVSSISKKILIPTVAISVLFFIALGLILSFSNRSDVESLLQSKAQSVSNLLIKMGGVYMDNFDFMPLEKIAEEAMRDKDVEYVGFFDLSGKRVAGKEPLTGKDVIQQEHDVVSQDGQRVGKMKVGYNSGTLKKNISKNATTIFIICSVGLVGFTFGFLILMRTMVIKPVQDTVDLLKDIATGEGDLTRRLPQNSDDEIGQLAKWFNTFMARLQENVGTVQVSTGSVSTSSVELEATAESITRNFKELVVQTEQTVSAITQISQTILDVAKNASDSAEASGDASKIAQTGKNAVERSVQGMGRIAQTVSAASETIGELGRSSVQIGNIVKVIDEIADQTNLLALNAAIEAARAGEQGRGFAVVADEVRKLAERTGRATKEISEMIKKIQVDTGKSVESMSAGKAEVEQGVHLVEEARTSLNLIVDASNKALDMVQRIATASEELSMSSEEISRNMESIMGISHSSSSAVEQVKSAARDLASLSNELQRRMGTFKV